MFIFKKYETHQQHRYLLIINILWSTTLVKLSRNGRLIGRKTIPIKQKLIKTNPNFMFWICFPILREQVYMLVIRWDILLRTFSAVTNA